MLTRCAVRIVLASRKAPLHTSLYRNLANGCGSSDDNEEGVESSNKSSSTCACPCTPRPSDINPSTPTMYDLRKYGHQLPSNDWTPCFEPLPNFPTGIWRCTTGEVLGQGADKWNYYQCPEYFSYHHMSYYDMHLHLRPCRQLCPKTGRKP